MAIATYTSICTCTHGDLYYGAYYPISAFMATAGWLQQNDTGQVGWPVTVIMISNFAFSTPTVTITFSITSGPNLVAGQSMMFSTNGNGNLGRFIIQTTDGTSTMTITNAGGSTVGPSANTAFGSTDTLFINPFTTLSVTSSVITFNYLAGSVLQGTMRIGQSIVVAGTSGGTYDATYVITGFNTTSFTAATAAGNVGSTACASATGTVNCTYVVVAAQESGSATIPPAAYYSFYEIWKMGDGNSFPVYLKIQYGVGPAGTNPTFVLTLSAGTDGAGNATGGSTGGISVWISGGVSLSIQSWMSGSTNRLQLALWVMGTSNYVPMGFVNIERSHDSSGSDTTSNQYATLTVAGTNSTVGYPTSSQISINAVNVTVKETGWPALVNHTTGTGSFGLSTLLSPVFPVVGAIGNPMIGMLVGKAADWANLTQFSFTMYNVAHNY